MLKIKVQLARSGTMQFMNDPLAKKSLGQHWLNDETSLLAMCEAADVGPEDIVLEIGPGLGSLTKHLVARAKQVIAVEFDTDLAKSLQQMCERSDLSQKLTVVEADILKFNFTTLPTGYKVVANIPYYLTSNLLRVLSESANPPSQMALLVQKEVAERVCAKPGSMSLLSVSVQLYYEAVLGEVVSAELFVPPPKVDSQILKLNRLSDPLFPRSDLANKEVKEFFRVVKAGFSNRRKTLHNSLSAGLQISKTEAAELLNSAGIEPSTRPQELSLENWRSLYLATK